jgi:hypothetical protein
MKDQSRKTKESGGIIRNKMKTPEKIEDLLALFGSCRFIWSSSPFPDECLTL